MPELVPCPACAELVREHACVCPHCGEKHPCTSRKLPAAALLLGLVAAGPGCILDKDVQADYAAPVTDSASADRDGDGWSPAGGDCDDDDENINPDATETLGDGIDSNCNDDDDT